MLGKFDAVLKQDAKGRFRRYASFHAAGIDLSKAHVDSVRINQLMKQYRDKFTRILQSSFKEPMAMRSTNGYFLNVDEALIGEAECFRRRVPAKRAPLRVGINLSRTHSSDNVTAIRGAAILALIELCKQRGQRVEIEVAYGNGHSFDTEGYRGTGEYRTYRGIHRCHVRIEVTTVSPEVLTRICCASEMIDLVGEKVIKQPGVGEGWAGVYRFHEFSWKEYDFILDRIETSDIAEEEKRITEQLKALKLVG